MAVSSFRPFSESKDIATNQLRAKQSWEDAFDHIVYFGDPEPELETPKTTFIMDSEQFPQIKRMMAAASFAGNDWVCLINSDIVVSSFLGVIVEECKRKKIEAITSMRYQFEPDDLDKSKAKVVDSGYDFFMTSPTMWAAAAKSCPEGYRIGHNRWDNWVLGFLNTVCRTKFVDVTNRRLIFHPRHGERKQPYHIEVPDDVYLKLGRPPFYKLK